MVYTPLTYLKQVIDPPLISIPFVTPSLSSTPRDTTIGDLTLLVSPLHLAQCMGLEMCDSSKGDASFVKDDLLDWSKELTLIESFLEKAPFEELCDDGMVVSAAPSFEHVD